MEYNNLATTPGPGWRTTHGLEPLRFVDGRVYYEEGVNSVKVFLPITGGNYKATLKKDAKASTGQDHYYWYDRLQQVRQHQRGTLTPTTPPYTGISSLQQTEVLTFDETGNWLSYSATSPSSVTQYRTHNKANWITALTGSPDGVDPVYANTGTMTTMPKVGAWTTAQTLVWDAWNRLIEVNEGGSDVSTNTYDAFHRRIRKVGGGETRDYYYDFNWRSVEERVGTPGSQTVKAQYTWSPTDRWTMIRRKRSTTSTLNEVLYVLKDYLDPAALFSSATSEIVERFGFDAFGPVRFMTEAFGSRGNSEYDWNFLFHAEFMDQESGLYNYGYRFYHSGLGRWLSRDPAGEAGGLNLYAMIKNSPGNKMDVMGLADCCVQGRLTYYNPDVQCCLPNGTITLKVMDDAEAFCCPDEIKIVEVRIDRTGFGHCNLHVPGESGGGPIDQTRGLQPERRVGLLDIFTPVPAYTPAEDGHPSQFVEYYRACGGTRDTLRESMNRHNGGFYQAVGRDYPNCHRWVKERLSDAGIKRDRGPVRQW